MGDYITPLNIDAFVDLSKDDFRILWDREAGSVVEAIVVRGTYLKIIGF